MNGPLRIFVTSILLLTMSLLASILTLTGIRLVIAFGTCFLLTLLYVLAATARQSYEADAEEVRKHEVVLR